MTGDERLRWSLEILSYLVLILGVPVAVYQHVVAKRAERVDRERAVFERAYLLYTERPTAASGRQWREWEVHIDGYLRRENVLRAWRFGESDYDPRFTAYVQERRRHVRRLDDHEAGD